MVDPGPKVAFIGGAGTVGSSAAFRLATLDIASEIVLIDARPNVAMSHVLDLEQAVAEISGTRIVGGDWADVAGCDIVVLSASLPERNVASRDEYLAGNLDIVRKVAGHLAACPEAVVIVATNPVDVFTFLLARLAGGAPGRFVGYSYNDTLRFRWALARTYDVTVADVDALVLGEHGDMQVPLFDRVSVKGAPVRLAEQQRQEVEAATRAWFSNYQSLGAGRTSGWTSAIGIGRLVAALADRAGSTGGEGAAGDPAAAATAVGDPARTANAGGGLLPCSAVLHGEYGLSEVSLGVPVVLGPGGIRQIVEFPLTPLEWGRLHAAAEKVRGLIDRASGLLGGEEAF
jgi:malate dehydrogenase